MTEYQERKIRNSYITNGLQYVLDNYRKISGIRKIDVVRKFIKLNYEDWDLIRANKASFKYLDSGDILGSKNEAYFNDENDYGTIVPTSNFHNQVKSMIKIGFTK